MGLGFKKRIRSKNMMIDKRIRVHRNMVDDEIEDFMIDRKNSTLLGISKKKGNIFS